MVKWWHVLAIVLAGLVMTSAIEPRGIRNNNPGNIRVSRIEWRGQVGDDGYFVRFDTPEHGIRALARVLKTYYYSHNLHSIAAMVSRYAPPNENDTAAYIRSVAGAVDFPGGVPMSAAKFDELLPELVQAIIKHENGQQPYSVAQIDRGVSLA